MASAVAKRRVAYYYQGDMGHYYYGPGHPMKPHRLKLTHHLILAYGLYRKLEVYRPHAASAEELSRFHSDDYVDFLRRITPEKSRDLSALMSKFNIGEYTDCPVFDGLYNFCQSYTGASIDGAVRLNNGLADIAINWAGGLHHAKKGEASGFCYINDIVMGILELLKYHQRVLYIDIDVHHGDGVEEAFYTTDRVMTASFHKFGDFFPGTGSIRDVGTKTGKYYSVNFPLLEGIDDLSYEHCFKPVIGKIMEVYRPGAIVLQCGADSLTADRLGCFNLTLKGHAECVRFVKSFGLPTLVLGGGGYTIRNVARCWANETATVLDEVLPDCIPPNDFIEFYRPDYRLHLDPAAMTNANTREYLDKCKAILLENLRYLEAAPGTQFTHVPSDLVLREVEEEARGGLTASAFADSRPTGVLEGRREADGEYYDDELDVDQDVSETPEGNERQRGVDRERRRKKGVDFNNVVMMSGGGGVGATTSASTMSSSGATGAMGAATHTAGVGIEGSGETHALSSSVAHGAVDAADHTSDIAMTSGGTDAPSHAEMEPAQPEPTT